MAVVPPPLFCKGKKPRGFAGAIQFGTTAERRSRRQKAGTPTTPHMSPSLILVIVIIAITIGSTYRRRGSLFSSRALAERYRYANAKSDPLFTAKILFGALSEWPGATAVDRVSPSVSFARERVACLSLFLFSCTLRRAMALSQSLTDG